ncbi:TPA: glycosyltransferase family 4 protein [Photobacterium damselae]
MQKKIIIINSSHDIFGGGQIYVREIRDYLKLSNIECEIWSSDNLTPDSILIPRIDSWGNKFKNVNNVIDKLPPPNQVIVITNDITLSMCSAFFKVKGYKIISLIHMSLFNTASSNKYIKKLYPHIRSALISIGSHKILNVNKENDSIITGDYVGNFINLKFSTNNNNRNIDLLYVGRFSEEKNPIAFVNIVNALIKQGINVNAVMIGDGDLYELVQSEISKNNIEKNIKLTGFLDRNDIFEFYKKSKILLITSKTEGLPTVLLEAAAFGVSFVSTKVGSIPWLADKYSIGKVEDIQYIEKYFHDNGFTVDESEYENLKKMIENHGISNFCERFLKKINE